jgi:hypothetical protein
MQDRSLEVADGSPWRKRLQVSDLDAASHEPA